jgi:hypothetical protein
MRTVLALPIIAGLAAAAAIPQDDDFDCIPRPFNGPLVMNPDTPAGFEGFPLFGRAALHAVKEENLPVGFVAVDFFVNLTAAAESSKYLGTYTPSKFSPHECAAVCDNISTCYSFNICISPCPSSIPTLTNHFRLVYERVPLIVSPHTYAPDPLTCPGLPTSPSATLIKCSFFSSRISAFDATNTGQYSDSFLIVFAGSTAFTRQTPASLPGYYGPAGLSIDGEAAIRAPYGYLGHHAYPGSEYEPELCAAACDRMKTAEGKKHCVFFNVYMLYKEGATPVLTCAFYEEAWGPAEAQNFGQVGTDGEEWRIMESYGYYAAETAERKKKVAVEDVEDKEVKKETGEGEKAEKKVDEKVELSEGEKAEQPEGEKAEKGWIVRSEEGVPMS